VNVGFQGFFGQSPYVQIEPVLGFNYPIETEKVVFIPFADVAAGMMIVRSFGDFDVPGAPFVFGISLKAGLMFRPIITSGFFVRAAFQYNIYRDHNDKSLHPAMLLLGVGFQF